MVVLISRTSIQYQEEVVTNVVRLELGTFPPISEMVAIQYRLKVISGGPSEEIGVAMVNYIW